MTIYAGETIVFKTSAVTVDDNPAVITDTDVSSATIEIYDRSDESVVVSSTDMTWDATDQEWRYSWESIPEGRYEARLRLIGPTFDTWEYQKVNVKADRY